MTQQQLEKRNSTGIMGAGLVIQYLIFVKSESHFRLNYAGGDFIGIVIEYDI